MGKILKTSIFAVIGCVMAMCMAVSCGSSGCTENRSALPLAEFYSSGEDKAIMLDSVEIYGIGAPDSAVLLKAGQKVSQVYLPMRATATRTSWCLAYRYKALNYPELNDTLSFDYDAIPYFASDDCGAMYRYRIRGVEHTTHLIDSVGVTDSLITNIDAVNIHIYFRTAQAATQSANSPRMATIPLR